jgi:hypothetical protein
MARTLWETIEGNAGQILAQLKRIVDEGNAAAIGALSALIADCTIEVEKTVAEEPVTPETEAPPLRHEA